MSVVFIEGFDNYNKNLEVLNTRWNYYWGSFDFPESGYRGGRCLRIRNIDIELFYEFNSPILSGIIGCWYKFTSNPGSTSALFGTTTTNGNLTNNSDLHIRQDTSNRLYISSNGYTVYSNVSPPLLINTWYHLELKYQIANSTTIVNELRINGIPTCFIPIGSDTLFGSYTEYKWFGIGCFTNACLDHLYLLDMSGSYNNDFIGPYIYVQNLVPTGNGNTNEWSKSPATGVSWDLVDDLITDYTGTYVYSSTSGNKELYNFSSPTGTVLSIKAICSNISAMKSGDYEMGIKHLCNNNQDIYRSGLKIGFIGIDKIYETNPDTSLPWTTGQLEDAQFGFELHYTGV